MTDRCSSLFAASMSALFVSALCSVTVCFAVSPAPASETPKNIDEAINAYQNALDTEDRNHRVQQFRRSERLFEKVIEQQLDGGARTISPDLYVNLGNAALGAEDLGVAILSYRRAQLIDANHRQAKQNLTHARSLLPKWIAAEDDAASFGSFMGSLRSRSSEELMGFATVVFVIMMLFIAISIRSQAKWARNLSILAGVVWCVLVVAATMSEAPAGQGMVVVVPEVMARSADSINAPARFPEPVPGGTELTLLEDRGDWVHSRLPDGREAWIPAGALEWVNPGAANRGL